MLRSSGRPCCLQLLNKQRRCRVALAARFADTTCRRAGGSGVDLHAAARGSFVCVRQHDRRCVAVASRWAGRSVAQLGTHILVWTLDTWARPQAEGIQSSVVGRCGTWAPKDQMGPTNVSWAEAPGQNVRPLPDTVLPLVPGFQSYSRRLANSAPAKPTAFDALLYLLVICFNVLKSI